RPIPCPGGSADPPADPPVRARCRNKLAARPVYAHRLKLLAVYTMRDRDPAKPDEVWVAFEAQAMPHVDRLFRLAMWWERDRREAEGLMQETLVRALQSFHRFTTGTSCHAWLVSILRHVRSD